MGMSPEQCLKARDILKWTREELAHAAGVTSGVVVALEDGCKILPVDEAAIRTTLESVGFGFPFEIESGRGRPAEVTYSPRDRRDAH
jgi:hypothetical protein